MLYSKTLLLIHPTCKSLGTSLGVQGLGLHLPVQRVRLWSLVRELGGFPGSLAGKESACNAGEPCSIPGSGRSPGEGIDYPTPVFLGFSGDSDDKEYTINAWDLGSISGLERFPGGGDSNSLQCCCLENPHGQRSLMRYSPRGCKESDTTKRLSTAQQEARVPHTSQPKKTKHKTKAISNKPQ